MNGFAFLSAVLVDVIGRRRYTVRQSKAPPVDKEGRTTLKIVFNDDFERSIFVASLAINNIDFVYMPDRYAPKAPVAWFGVANEDVDVVRQIIHHVHETDFKNP